MKSSSSPTLRWLAVALLVLTALPVVLSLRLQPPTSSPSLRGDSEWVKEDEIVVDLKDDASTQDIQALEDKFGIDLRFNSEYADDDNLMVAHVDPSRQSELVAELRQEPTVEVAARSRRPRGPGRPRTPRRGGRANPVRPRHLRERAAQPVHGDDPGSPHADISV